ncbi:MAG: rod shape-determining protein MreC [Bryobacterales bacterium]|nr:rod shape-determining protein MreC [Bryobacterales bacterium]
MQKSLWRRAKGILPVALILLQVLMVGQQIESSQFNSYLTYWSSALFRPLQIAGQRVRSSVSGAWSGYVGLVGVAADNRKLESEAARLQLENHYLRNELAHVRDRAELDDFRASLASLTLAATVIARGPHRSTREVFLDRGRDHGVRPGMAVLAPGGIVGKVEAVFNASSMVILLSDADAGAGVVLGQSGAPGVLRGTGSALSRLDYLPSNVAVRVNEQVFTSGLDGVFPTGMPVGEVVSVGGVAESHAIRVRLHADLDRVREVAVVLRAKHEALPDAVQRRLAQLLETPLPSIKAPQYVGPADRVKLAYRRALAAQGARVGLLGGRPPDFRTAIELLRTARDESPGASGEAE